MMFLRMYSVIYPEQTAGLRLPATAHLNHHKNHYQTKHPAVGSFSKNQIALRHRKQRPFSMSSPSSNPTKQAATIRQSKSPPFKFLVPLVYAPALPLIRIALRNKPVLRDRLFIGVLVGAFAHGTYLVADLYDSESK